MSQFDPRVTAYFGDAVLQAGFMPLPHLFLRHYRQLGLSAAQAMFLLQLMEIAWDKGEPPTTSSKLAARMGVSRRMITTYSQEVQGLGLVEIYDQYGPDGAQTENGYDLSPLFARLADFAPPQLPPGELRPHARQRVKRPVERFPVRDGPPADLALVTTAQPGTPDASSPEGGVSSQSQKPAASPPGTGVPPLPGNLLLPSPGTGLRGGLEADFHGKQKQASRLNKEGKNQNQESGKKNQQQHAAAAGRGREGNLQPSPDQLRAYGRSLRWNVLLTAADVTQSRLVLQLLGLNAVTVDAAAPALHPAECWSLACYARSRQLGVAWIAQQIYDARERQPRLTVQARSFDAVGQKLAKLPEQHALLVLDVVDRYCPGDHETATDELNGVLADESALHGCTAALDTLWPKMEAERSTVPGHARHRTAVHGLAVAPRDVEDGPAAARTSDVEQQVFTVALARLRDKADATAWDTWLSPLTLLHAGAETVVIGAPNCFVRDEVASKYTDPLAHAFEDALGRPVAIEVVIG